LTEARREAEGSNVHLLDGDEQVIDGVRFLGATLWTNFELTVETPEGPISDFGRAMKMATNLLNDYALIPTVDESAEPDTWRDKQGKTAPSGGHASDSSGAARVAARQASRRESAFELNARGIDLWHPFAGPPSATTGLSPLQANFGEDRTFKCTRN
jgi:hypothetical protein